MSYTLSWYTPEKVLYLAIEGRPSLQELETMNDSVMNILEESSTLSIVIEATNLRSSYYTADQLRDTQRYMNHSKLDTAFIIADNKLNRLITLMAFSLCRAKFMQYDTKEAAEVVLRRYGFAPQA